MKGKTPPSLTVYAYTPAKQLCVVQTLNRYLEMTKERRDPSRTKPLLSYRKSYGKTTVETNTFNGNCTRWAFTSKVNLKGLALSDIVHGDHGQEHQLGKNFTRREIPAWHALLKNNWYML